MPEEIDQNDQKMTLLAVKDKNFGLGYGILDSGSSRHLVNDLRLLDNVEDYTSECLAADGGTLHITKR